MYYVEKGSTYLILVSVQKLRAYLFNPWFTQSDAQSIDMLCLVSIDPVSLCLTKQFFC